MAGGYEENTMGDDAEYEIERQEEERRLAEADPSTRDVQRLIDRIVDNCIPRRPGEPRVVLDDSTPRRRR